MNLDRPRNLLSSDEIDQVTNNLAGAKKYGDPRQVWVEDGHVFIEGHDGEIIAMTPAVAIKMGRMLGEAGAASLINNVMDESAKKKGLAANGSSGSIELAPPRKNCWNTN
jgi:hypothetical protein